MELFAKTKDTVEATLTKLGIDPAKSLVKATDDQASYTLMRGSASVLVTVVHRADQDAVFLRVASPVMTLQYAPRRGRLVMSSHFLGSGRAWR